MGKQVAAGFHGGVAQLGEHLPCKQGVKSSNLSVSINRETKKDLVFGWRHLETSACRKLLKDVICGGLFCKNR